MSTSAVSTAVRWSVIESPVGPLLVARDDEGITHLYLDGGRHPRAALDGWVRDDTAFDDIRGQLGEYFAGTRTEFDLPLHASGTEFQKRAWAGLCEIPFGETWTYSQLAEHIGSPTAVRAVGSANGQNPISIIVPCHRVIGADGSLTGYGGGLDNKRRLLEHEGRQDGLFAV